MVKAYIVQSQRRVEPFGDYPRDCLIGNQPLAQHQEETLRDLELEPAAIPDASQIGDTGEHVVLRDSLFFTRELLQEFLSRSRELRVSTVCCLKPGLSTLSTIVPTQDVPIDPDRVEYGLHYLPTSESAGEPHPVEQAAFSLPDERCQTVGASFPRASAWWGRFTATVR